MRCFSLLLAQALLVACLAEASPLQSPFERAAESISEHGRNLVSTELSLRPPALDIHPDPVRSADVPYAASRSTSPQHSPIVSESIPPLQAPPPDEVAASSHDSHLHLLAQTASEQTLSPRIDAQITGLPTQYGNEGRIRLAKDQVYIRSPWMSDVYDRILRLWRPRKRFDRSEVAIPAELVAQINAQGHRIFVPRGEAYMLRIPASWLPSAGISRPLEVLFRYHSHIKMPTGRVSGVVSIWTTADRGRKLALLGIFRMGTIAFHTGFTKMAGVQRFHVTSLVEMTPVPHSGLHLVPQP
ncbi:hypothetical protein PSEUBRA_004044 [Kalmanozyma brasiliensis GHG001]|uniref:uncharacterized protein n=1 Tax=Kalmanozyma brasiliensis (strain GHG001) TaxID=1365824 RepID=UPI002867F5E1|nr:uncharacterized protein PSEUBRA_004044 [Kalmanozyma brasiliensis GHG001]KAF6767332.1 hypothetical protein PSEUBRA_004044 [Kalmanozyma brasiliensis GHG001]